MAIRFFAPLFTNRFLHIPSDSERAIRLLREQTSSLIHDTADHYKVEKFGPDRIHVDLLAFAYAFFDRAPDDFFLRQLKIRVEELTQNSTEIDQLSNYAKALVKTISVYKKSTQEEERQFRKLLKEYEVTICLTDTWGEQAQVYVDNAYEQLLKFVQAHPRFKKEVPQEKWTAERPK